MSDQRPDNVPSAELYIAIVEAERVCRRAHDLCYGPDRRANGATYWLTTRLGKCQSILMHYVVKHAGWYEKRLG